MTTEKTIIYHEIKTENSTPKRNHYPKEFKQQIISEYNKGIPKQELTKKYNLNISTLNNWIKKQQENQTTIKINKNNLKIQIKTLNNHPQKNINPNINISIKKNQFTLK